MRVSLRVRLAFFVALLVLTVGAGVSAASYLSFRHSLLSKANSTAQAEAQHLRALVTGGGSQVVDMSDPSLTQQLSAPGLLVELERPSGAVIQSTPRAGHERVIALTRALARRCLSSGSARSELGGAQLAVACVRVGGALHPQGTIVVGVPLRNSLQSLATLRRTLILALISGAVLAGALSLLVARRALKPLRRIAATANTIRSGDLSRRVHYRGRDELGEVTEVLDACFAELEAAMSRQRRFAADASHELRTPLAAIRANLELLREWASTEPSTREGVLASLDSASRRASRLVADLLTLVRADEEVTRRESHVRLDQVILGAVSEAGSLRPDVGVRVVQLTDIVIPEADPSGLHQIIVNLLENALEVSPRGAEVQLRLTAAGGAARVLVSDQGEGIEPEALERIFDRFYSRKARKESQSGSGLGLAIARTIARQHGGELVARNNDEGGATFELRLPLAQVDVPAPDRAGEAALTQPVAGR